MIDKKKFVKNLKIREKYFKYMEFSREDKAKIHRVRDIPLPAPELQKLLRRSCVFPPPREGNLVSQLCKRALQGNFIIRHG